MLRDVIKNLLTRVFVIDLDNERQWTEAELKLRLLREFDPHYQSPQALLDGTLQKDPPLSLYKLEGLSLFYNFDTDKLERLDGFPLPPDIDLSKAIPLTGEFVFDKSTGRIVHKEHARP